jgi:hypothetical protein
MQQTKESQHMSEFSEKRLWATLDAISADVKTIQNDLKEVVRIGERVNSHHDVLTHHTKQLDTLDSRLRENELWQANFGDRKTAESTVSELRNKIRELELGAGKFSGEKAVTKSVVFWCFSLLSAYIIFKITAAGI